MSFAVIWMGNALDFPSTTEGGLETSQKVLPQVGVNSRPTRGHDFGYPTRYCSYKICLNLFEAFDRDDESPNATRDLEIQNI